MWFPFWRSRNRFSVEELRYLTDQLHNVHIVNDVNKDFVIEALRSISELITYGDQNDPAFFDFFMEREVMGELVRILKISKPLSISLQLLQTMGIIIQNLKNERAICYMFSNINNLITYSFNFDNEELLSYFISFLRATSGKLNKTTISLLVNTENEEVVSFPLYVEAIQFAFHEENMIRTAIRAITLNVYHVGDESVNRFVAKQPHAKYFSSMIKFFRRQCVDLNGLVSNAIRSSDPDTLSDILVAVDEIEDTLYYFSDITSAGIPDVGMLITKKMWKHLVFPLLLPSLRTESTNDIQLGSITSMYLLCCILHIVKIKDLANVIAAGLFCPPEVFVGRGGSKVNGLLSGHDLTQESQQPQTGHDSVPENNNGPLRVIIPVNSRDSQTHQEEDNTSEKFFGAPHIAMRDTLLSFVRNGDDAHVLASLSMLAMLLQTKGCTVRSIQLTDRVLISSSISLFVELDESMLDALGILPQRKQHKKLLLEALVGEASAEEQLFSSGASLRRDSISSELDDYLQRLKSHYGLSSLTLEEGASPRIHRFQVLDSLVALFGRSNLSAETLWYGGWLLRQLLPYGEAEFSSHHLVALKDSYGNCFHLLLEESRGIWPDLLVTVICDEWKKCKRAIEAPSPRKEPKSILTSLCKPSEDSVPSESSFAAGARMCEMVKVFVLVHQLLLFSYGKTLPDQPAINPPMDVPENSRAKTAGLDAPGPKPGTELELVDALPCRISFERGKERHFHFLAASLGTSGWILLAEELPLKQRRGVVRVAAPLASSNPVIDEKHPKWLHLKIRPSTLPSLDPTKGKGRRKPLVDGRWTLAFRDESSCKAALNMVVNEKDLQSKQVERRLQPLMNDVIGSSTLSKSNLSSSTQA